jgi:hypothetical protein
MRMVEKRLDWFRQAWPQRRQVPWAVTNGTARGLRNHTSRIIISCVQLLLVIKLPSYAPGWLLEQPEPLAPNCSHHAIAGVSKLLLATIFTILGSTQRL